MGRNQAIFPIALACSLVLHLAGMTLYVTCGSFLLSSDTRPARSAELVIKVDPQLFDFGDAAGTANGSNSSPGERPMQARQAEENQALLSREPAGFGKIAQPASELNGPAGEGSISSTMALAVPPLKTPEPLAPAPVMVKVPDVPAAAPGPQVQVSQSDADLKPKVVQEPSSAVQSRPAEVAVAGENQDPGVPTSAGKPLPQSESDSDPFSRISGAVVFHNGRLDVQLGRKVTTVNPQLGIAGEMDAYSLNNPTLIIEVHIKPGGDVSNVEIVKTSGSIAIDEPWRNAVYQWKFEPAHDKAGHPIRDVVCFAVKYR